MLNRVTMITSATLEVVKIALAAGMTAGAMIMIRVRTIIVIIMAQGTYANFPLFATMETRAAPIAVPQEVAPTHGRTAMTRTYVQATPATPTPASVLTRAVTMGICARVTAAGRAGVSTPLLTVMIATPAPLMNAIPELAIV